MNNDLNTNLITPINNFIQDNIKLNLNSFFRAYVVNTEDPEKLGRVKVRIPSLHGYAYNDNNYLADSMLPWATPAVWSAAGNNMGEFNPPTVGTLVFVTFENEDRNYPIYFGGIPTRIGNKKYYRGGMFVNANRAYEISTDDYNLDIVNGTEKVMFKSLKGATIIVDDYDGKEYIKIIDQSGQVIKMGNNGEALPRRVGENGISSTAYIELSNNRGEIVRITDGQVYIDGDETYINSQSVRIPHWSGGGSGSDYYTKEETDKMLENKNRIFFEEPTIPYNVNDLWYNGNVVYRCVNKRTFGEFNSKDWEIDTSFMTPEAVQAELTKLEDKIKLEMKSTYVTPAYVDEKMNYEILIYSSQGNIFRNGIVSTVLTAFVRQGNTDVTSKFEDNQFVWTRSSDDPEGDISWNRKYIGGCRSILVTADDVINKATFICELLDKINTLNYVKSGLIELFDGYDEPTAGGEWQSMIRTNTAIIPTSGVTYNSSKHGYEFKGTKSALRLYNPIKLVAGNTYEFVTGLSSYSETQNILSSDEEDNKYINTRIACAVAGHLQLKKDSYSLNAGNILLNRKAYVSIRYVDEDHIEVYYNGVFGGTYTQSEWTSIPSNMNLIGKYCNGIIYSIRVYNRILTPQEIETNHNEDLNRFPIQ